MQTQQPEQDPAELAFCQIAQMVERMFEQTKAKEQSALKTRSPKLY
jgi:hypothetical protein